MTGTRASLHTLGCKLNYAETSALARGLAEQGFSIVPFGEQSDVVVLNTCSVTENAEKECRQLIRRIRRQSPKSKIVVTGCYAQLRPEEIASIDGVSLVLGASEKFNIFQHLPSLTYSAPPRIAVSEIEDAHEFHAASSLDDRTRAFLKIQDGCDYSCSFCTIPKARGASRSAEVEDILARAIELCHDGFHEIILSGVNVGDFGRKTGSSFLQLIRAMDAESEITARIRISSIEPNLLSDEIIGFVAGSEKFCPHFHIPLQSGSSRILRLMQRRYQPDLYRSRVEVIKRLMPHAAVGADVIVGFPGETDRDFIDTIHFIESLELSYLHVFTYSERPGTNAATMSGTVPMQIRRDRNRTLRLLGEKMKRSFHESQCGRDVTVVLEPCGEGYSENYVRVRLNDRVAHGAELVRVSLDECRGDLVLAEPLEVLAHRREPLLLPIL
ncbi:MAG: tRNA (N(6)-L-threonylcarbamoyladenosine(37)-C(2))-methylthiotransferase MtaB [Bacteroidota bacterium]|nr:tRNA (N(6)-L-threonylcarbamoyladenosine(37)-C(2))-methylthiotransferase MtaB [Bacteroidota bacterium]MDP4233940.1 tRNA (N(6)-L-threonylcarbamoyladenosine(37)-C(2))-methylthiotransferase MtaB [Bacteroidota bacterium]MDP4242809.1 tRNA (N(6)-L-threonylcarbamoyladenosine(37)-C(2))-methylthiotransferase MtaB [Bacteroidota bacterium]MDP4288287.1 tRNA (N(6)-L-threonylcarbamoyladenosine(37)-C(2))-methylthiotransferase MtaB [Bacteroidota bacterium]